MSSTTNIPKRKRMGQPQRLIVAKEWLKKNQGKRIVSRYAKWFAVDLLCAIKELRLLGVDLAPEYEEQVKRSVINKVIQKKKKSEAQQDAARIDTLECNEHFAFIIGYTSGGAPYGITWEEWQEDEPGTEQIQNLNFF